MHDLQNSSDMIAHSSFDPLLPPPSHFFFIIILYLAEIILTKEMSNVLMCNDLLKNLF